MTNKSKNQMRKIVTSKSERISFLIFLGALTLSPHCRLELIIIHFIPRTKRPEKRLLIEEGLKG